MLRAITGSITRSAGVLAKSSTIASTSAAGTQVRFLSKEETPEEFDQRFVDFFNRSDIDGWQIRSAMTQLSNADLIPEPKIIAAALRACRRVNDYSLCVRFLENVKWKCGSKKHLDEVWPWLLQEIKPVMDELGIKTPDELGYDKPELFVPQPEWWWEKEWYAHYGFDKNPDYRIN